MIDSIKTGPAEFFPILPWDPLHGFSEPFIRSRPWGLESVKDCNFTMAGFVWPEDLPLCEQLGLKAFIIDREGFISSAAWRQMSDREIDDRIRRVVSESAASPAVMGYFITDEPGASAFPALGKAVEAVRKYAPGKLAYVNLFPDYATLGAKDISQLETNTYTEHLERFIREVKPEVLSYDNYKIQFSMDQRYPDHTASYYNNLLEIRRVGLKYGVPFWNIVSSNQIRPITTVPSPANLALQAYTTLAAGGKGVTWYTYYARGYGYAPIDEAGRKTMTWHYLKEVNRQVLALGPVMNRLSSTGVFFSSPQMVQGLPLLPGRLVASLESDVPMMVGEFSDGDGVEYAMVVNLSLERSARFTFRLVEPRGVAHTMSSEDGSLAAMDSNAGLWLTAGQGTLIKIRQQDESERRTVIRKQNT